MKILLTGFGILISSSLFAQKDTLYRVCLDYELVSEKVELSIFPQCGYVDKKGTIIVPVGKYQACFTDEFIHYAVVFKQNGKKPVAINRKGKELFEVFWFDNGPDYVSDGLFRIVGQNGKIGYADETGKIVIKPQFSWGEAFENGYAEVTYSHREVKEDEHTRIEADRWITIDKTGEEIILPQPESH